MNRRTRTTPDRLPLPTPSEAAFERVLNEFRGEAPPALAETHDAFVERLFQSRKQYEERDDFAGIGERDAFPTKIMGVSFEGRQDIIAGLRPGVDLALQRQPDNPVDANAIAVAYGNLQLGFLRKEIARHLAPLIDGGTLYRARVEHVTGGVNGRNFGVNVRVWRDYQPAPTAFTVESRARTERDDLRAALIGSRQPREAQLAALSRIDAGHNTLLVMGTGRGKSFCFQYPAAHRAIESEQKTLVLYPLRALANDQHDALTRRFEGFGLRVFRANGAIGPEEREELMRALESGAWDVVLSTPEFLQYHRASFSGPSAPALVVVDEAHHMHESKHRPAYGNLGQTLRAMGSPQTLALTATAGDEAFASICRELAIDRWVIDPTVRDNLHVVDARGKKDKLAYLRELFAGEGKGIVYCMSRSEAAKVADALRSTLKNTVAFYHAGMPTPERTEVERLFREGMLRVIVATSAFGEGIDLPDVRNVVLYHLNFDFTEFNQQAGRAGRDGDDAFVHLLFGESDRRINDFIIDRDAPTLYVLRELYKGMRGLAAGGELRMPFTDIARTLDLDKADERTVSFATRIFEDEGLLESGVDDDGRYLRFLPVVGKTDLTKNERFAEGEAAREMFGRFCELVLSASASALERIINRPIYPERGELLR